MPKSRRYQRVVAAVHNTPWAILPSKLSEITGLLDLRSQGVRLSREEIRERLALNRGPQIVDSGKVAVLNLFGTISQRMTFLSEFSGGTSTEEFGRAFQAAINDDDISAIVINIDSPGGAVPGVQELSDKIFEARGTKPIVAVVNPMMASAAYWIGSAADEIVAIPSATDIGSIGVLTIHRDDTKADEEAGYKYTIVRSVEFKAEGTPYEALSEAAREHLEERVGKIHTAFIETVARNRGVSTSRVESDFGRGRTYLAKDAVAAGMADRIATLEQVLSELGVGAGSSSSVGAQHRTANEECKMNKQILTHLIRAGLVDADCDEHEYKAAIKIAFRQMDAEVPDGDEKTLAVLKEKKPSALFSTQLEPARIAARVEQTVEGVDVSDIIASINLSPLSADDKLELQGQLIKEASNLSYSQLLDRINEKAQKQASSAGPTTITTKESEVEKFQVAARDAILLRSMKGKQPERIFDFQSGDYVDWKPERGNHGLSSLLSLSQQCLVQSGIPSQTVYSMAPYHVAKLVMGADARQLGIPRFSMSSDGPAYNVSGMFSNILLDAANVSLRRSFDDARTTFQLWMGKGEDIRDFKPVHRVIAGEFGDPKAVPEDGEFEETTLSDGKESYKLTVWGEIFSHSWQLIVNDQLSSFMEAPQKMGNAMRRKINRIAYQVLKDNAQLSDGVALFDNSTHDNLTTGTLTTSADYIAAWNTMSKKMREQRGLDADSGTLNIPPQWALFPPALRGPILQALNSTSVALSTQGNEGTANIWQGQLQPVEEAELSAASTGGSDTAHYLMASSMDVDTVEYAYLQGMPSPVVEQEMAFDRLAMRRRIYFAFGTKALDYRGQQKHTGA